MRIIFYGFDVITARRVNHFCAILKSFETYLLKSNRPGVPTEFAMLPPCPQQVHTNSASRHIILSAITSSIITFCIMQLYNSSTRRKRNGSVHSQNENESIEEDEHVRNNQENLQSTTDGKEAISVHSLSSCISEEDKNEFVKKGFLASIGRAEFEANDNKSNRRLSSVSFSGHFLNVDGVDRQGSTTSVDSTDETDLTEESRPCDGTSVKVLSEEYYEDDTSIMQAKEFDTNVLSKLTTLEESHMLLRRTRAVSALASRLMGAPDEQACFEEVTKLLVVRLSRRFHLFI